MSLSAILILILFIGTRVSVLDPWISVGAFFAVVEFVFPDGAAGAGCVGLGAAGVGAGCCGAAALGAAAGSAYNFEFKMFNLIPF